MALKNVLPKGTTVKVSSTFDNQSHKKYLLDGSNETCWSSTQGLPQHIHLFFPTPTPASSIALTFQGGYSGTTMSVYVHVDVVGENEDESVASLGLEFGGKVFGRDGNGRQVFEIPFPPEHLEDDTKPLIKELKIEFEKSADPFGRVVVYELEVLG